MYTASNRLKVIALGAGDLLAAYAALWCTLAIRYGTHNLPYFWDRHFIPFTAVFALWIVIFFIVGLYDFHDLRSRFDLLAKSGEALVTALLVSITVFYVVPSFSIAPKTNLAITIAVFAVLFIGWRVAAMLAFSRPKFRTRVVFLGAPPEADDLCATIARTPQIGFECAGIIRDPGVAPELPPCDLIVVSHLLEARGALTRPLYERYFASTAGIVDFPSFHERIRRSVPASALSEQWVLQNLATREGGVYDHLKRPLDVMLAAVLSVPALLITPLIALAVAADGTGPVFYRQVRVGRSGRRFDILKFRTMRSDAEASGAAFAVKDDPRVTRVGHFLRRARLDEIPQLWNILKGDMSFVGPRPERPEFEDAIAKDVPVFPVRHLIRPGLTGWAQVNDAYATTKDEHLRKLLRDLYYLKHRSFTLDIAIILRTAYSVVKRTGM